MSRIFKSRWPASTRHALFCKPIQQPMDRFAYRLFALEITALP
jgi:hypothetical protein